MVVQAEVHIHVELTIKHTSWEKIIFIDISWVISLKPINVQNQDNPPALEDLIRATDPQEVTQSSAFKLYHAFELTRNLVNEDTNSTSLEWVKGLDFY